MTTAFRSVLKPASLTALALLLTMVAGCDRPPEVNEALWHHRNLGKAFYENPATQYKAVAEFKAALDLEPDSARERVNYGLALMRAGQVEEGVAELERAQKQDPSIPHTWFSLALAYKNDSRYPEALKQFERMVQLVPDEPKAHYNLGVLYKLEGRNEEAQKHFERAAELAPTLAGPHFQLATAYRQAGRTEDALRETTLFRELKKAEAAAAVPEDLEWSPYVEIYDTIDPLPAAVAPVAPVFETRELGRLPAPAGLAVLDAEGDRRADLLAWSADGVILHGGGDTPRESGLEGVRGALAIAPADHDNDGRVDLCVVTPEAVRLFINTPGSENEAGDTGVRFTEAASALAGPGYTRAIWLDYDHDYDLDLFLLGRRSALLRNNGPAGFEDRSADFPFAQGQAIAGATIDVESDAVGRDLLVTYADRPGVLYRDRLGGNYEAIDLPQLAAGVDEVAVDDFDNDGWADISAAGPGGVTLWVNDHAWGFDAAPAPKTGPGVRLTWADLDNRGVRDLLAGKDLLRNRGRGKFERSAESPFADAGARVAADFDDDGRIDVAEISPDGAWLLRLNRTETGNAWLRIDLEGVKNLKLAPGAEVEIKAGSNYQKDVYRGLPLLFGVSTHQAVDTVRITWPNSLVQNEPQQAVGSTVKYQEAARLSGSCPMIFTWNGTEFQFISDVLGVAPLGASAGDGKYFPVDHDEYVHLPPGALVPRDGRYEVRITEELAEVAFIDQIKLIAVDHPADVALFTNDKFKSPPFPEYRLFGVERPVRPIAARDQRGGDVLDRVLAADRSYVDTFQRDYAGVAEMHHLELDFGAAAPDGRAILVLNGWLDWADGSTFLRVSRESPEGLVMPYLQVQDADGRWQTVIDDMGMPAGKAKHIVVDLTGKFPTRDRRVRIVSNLIIYWDEAFLGEDPGAPQVRQTEQAASRAELDFRGFSQVIVHPKRLQPETFVYAQRRFLSNWNPTPGRYTRFGDVEPLLGTIDDRLVVMGSGDELTLEFDASAFPALPDGWSRDFLLFVDGWAKDSDPNTAFSTSVLPLPYHGMPEYPYADPHRYPDDATHTLYREHYLTREALRLIRPLTEDLRH